MVTFVVIIKYNCGHLRVFLSHIILFFVSVNVIAQDIHFSQNIRSDFQINPAFTGAFSGNIRATANWKDQWQSINKSFRTYATQIEISFGKGRAHRPTFFALGIHAFKDVAGDVEVGNTSAGLSFASFVKINRNSRFIGGIQGSYGMMGLNTANMQWGSQYNGISYDPTLFNGEGVDFQPYQYLDMAMGVAYWYSKNDRNVIQKAPADAKIGLSVYHINRPHYSFDVNGEQRLPRRAVLHTSALFSTNVTNTYWYPNFNLMVQGRQHEVYFGSLWKYVLISGSKSTGFTSEVSFTGGLNMRVTNVIDALVPQLFISAYNFSVGLSYDVNVSRLNAASNYRGGFEFSLRFTNPDSYVHRNPFRHAVSI